VDCALRVLRIQVDNDYLGVLILDLPEYGVGRSKREAYMAEYDAGDVSRLDLVFEGGALLPVLREYGNRYAMHDLILFEIPRRLHGMSGKPSEPSDLGNNPSKYDVGVSWPKKACWSSDLKEGNSEEDQWNEIS
jgi:hypothetical protein